MQPPIQAVRHNIGLLNQDDAISIQKAKKMFRQT